MILSRTPLRVSFCGGGSDIKDYYSKFGGAVTSTAINKYVYITLNERSDGEIWLKYSTSEIIRKIGEIEHPIFREALRMTGIRKGIEISSMADIPSRGSGLGSSCTFTVGLLNALHKYLGEQKDVEFLAEGACELEINKLKEPIGKQDQYAAAYGGLNYISFAKDGNVKVERIKASKKTLGELNENLLLFFTGITRSTKSILSQQRAQMAKEKKLEAMHKMVGLAGTARDALNGNDITKFGELLHENWLLKKSLTGAISNSRIDKHYNKAVKAGALGGKLCGAGYGGHLLFYAEKGKQDRVRKALGGMREVKFSINAPGTKIIYEED